VIEPAEAARSRQCQLDGVILPYRTSIDDAVGLPRRLRARRATPGRQTPSLSVTGLPTIIVPGGFFPSTACVRGAVPRQKPFHRAMLIKLASGFEPSRTIAGRPQRRPLPVKRSNTGEARARFTTAEKPSRR